MSPLGTNMTDERNRYKTTEMAETMQRAQGQLYVVSQKLQAFGILLKRQGKEHEGFVELCGLGITLAELGDELYQLWYSLDIAHFTPRETMPAGSLPGRSTRR